VSLPHGEVLVLVAQLKSKVPTENHAIVEEIGRLYGLTLDTEDPARIVHLSGQIQGHLIDLGLAAPAPDPVPDPGPPIDFRTRADHDAFIARYGA